MGRKSRLKKERRKQKPKQRHFPVENTANDLRQANYTDEIFDIFCAPLEPLTDALIDELCKKGWEKEDLLWHQEQGRGYNRKRNTIM